MKCLLCGLEFDKDIIKDHYINFHKVDANNYFFKKVFSKNNKVIRQKCLRCNDFITTKYYQNRHNFLKHYSDEKSSTFENKPIEIKITGDITTYEITVGKHGEYYNFSNSDEIIEEFLLNVRSKFKSASTGVIIKCGFSIQNIQPAPSDYTVPILNVRYLTTEPYKTTYFNDFIFVSLKEDIQKRVINNGLTGSSW